MGYVEREDDFTILVQPRHASELVGYGPDKVGFSVTVAAREDEWGLGFIVYFNNGI